MGGRQFGKLVVFPFFLIRRARGFATVFTSVLRCDTKFNSIFTEIVLSIVVGKCYVIFKSIVATLVA